MNKKEERIFFDDIEALMKKTEVTYQLSALLTKFCDLNPDSDDLYEVSCVIKIIKENIDDLSHELYHLAHRQNKPAAYENMGPRIKKILKK